MWLSIIGLVAIVVVLWLLRNKLRTHNHQCPNCKHVWKHRGIIAMWQKTSHNCPKCGTEQYWGYFGCTPPDESFT